MINHVYWIFCVQTDQGFDQVQDLITQTASLLNNTLSFPCGYSYSPGRFSKLINKSFMDDFQANADHAQKLANQKAIKANWYKICKNYKIHQNRMADIQKEANQHKGAWKVIFGVGAVVIGVVAIVATAGAATPLVAVAWTAGKAYKVGGNGAKVEELDNSNKYSLSGEEHYENLKDLFGTDNVEWVTKGSKYDNAVFADDEKLVSHYWKHGKEFGAYSLDDYLNQARDVMNNGYEVNYPYKGY